MSTTLPLHTSGSPPMADTSLCCPAFYDMRQPGLSSGAQQRLHETFGRVKARADALAVPNELGALLQSAGGIGLNASTSHDATRFYVSLPTNALELWFALESERMQARP